MSSTIIQDNIQLHKSDETGEWRIEFLDNNLNKLLTIQEARDIIDRLEKAMQRIEPSYNINQIKIKDIKGFQSNSNDIKIWNVYYRTNESNDLKIALVSVTKDQKELYAKIFELEAIPIELLDKLTRVVFGCKEDLFNINGYSFKKEDFILEYIGD